MHKKMLMTKFTWNDFYSKVQKQIRLEKLAEKIDKKLVIYAIAFIYKKRNAHAQTCVCMYSMGNVWLGNTVAYVKSCR